MLALSCVAITIAVVAEGLHLSSSGARASPNSNYNKGRFVAGSIGLFTLALSMHDIAMHVLYYYSGFATGRCEEKGLVIRILLLVPLNAVAAWLTLMINRRMMYVEAVAERYNSHWH